MKKSSFLLLLFAAASVFFASCGDEEESLTLNDNQLAYDGVVYNMNCSAFVEHVGDELFAGFSGEGENQNLQLTGMFGEGSVNQTYNIAVHNPGVHMNVDFYAESMTSFSFDNNMEGFFGGIAGVDNVEGSIFSEGTLSNTFDENGFRVYLKGTLINGKKIEFKVFVPTSELEVI